MSWSWHLRQVEPAAPRADVQLDLGILPPPAGGELGARLCAAAYPDGLVDDSGADLHRDAWSFQSRGTALAARHPARYA